jgi:dolichyl-phosphate-mannose-protein mannosyltransferase
MKHFLARVFCLICIPLAFYMALFAIHFICLVNPGDGDGFMSSEFQATLNSKGMQDVPADVVLGSRVSLRHLNTQGGYLHSHNHMYPTGSKQQQITLYPHKDDNNLWLLENQTQPLGPDGQAINGSLAWDNSLNYLEDGAVVRLYHIMTDRRLHSHDVRPPITEAEWQNEVSAYGYAGFEGDANDLFKVEIQKSMSDGEVAKKRVRTIETKFRLIHIMSGCALFSHKVKLPDWGFEQQEVTCAKQGTLPNSIWYIESNDHPKLGPSSEKVNYRNPGFLGKFWELQKVMWRTNAGLVDSHAWDSRPPSWPILRRGINFWGKEYRQIYLIGNPIIWWSSTAAILIYAVFKGISILRWQRGFKDYDNVNYKRFDYEIGSTVLGWGFHYFPFFLMSRQLFLHHYLPALYFAIIALCQVYDFVANRISSLGLRQRPEVGKGIMVLFLCLSITAFTLYAPLSYGNPWTKASCRRVKLFDTWDWDCNNFLDEYSQYANLQYANTSVAAVSESSARPLVDPQADDKAREAVSGKAAGGPEKVIKADKVEYRDQDGNLLNEEQVKALEGKASFSTRYETRSGILDADGHVIMPDVAGVAPPHPDAESGTKEVPENEGRDSPPSISPEQDLQKEKSVEEAATDKPKPASEANEATKK